MKVRYTHTALAELEEILAYIAQDNPKAVAGVAVAVDRTVAWIANHPEAAPIVFQNTVRAKLAGRTQYRIFYTVSGSDLIVRNIRSTKRRRPWESGTS